MVTPRAITVKFMIPKRPGTSGWMCVYVCVCGSSGGRKGMNSPQTLATQTEALRAALISVQRNTNVTEDAANPP